MALELMRFSHHKKNMKIISLEGDAQSAIDAWPRLSVIRDQLIFLNKKPGLQISLISELKRIIKGENADVVHTHHIGPYFYAGIASSFAGINVIHTEHDAWHYQDFRHRLLYKIASFFVNSTLIADAKIVANMLKVQLGNKEITVIKNGIDVYKYLPGDQKTARSLLGLPLEVKLVGVSGRLEDVKGHANLIEAIGKLPEDIHLAIAGSGTLEQSLRALTKTSDLEHRIHFLGHLDDMPIFYQSLDLFCLPSLNEGFPLSPLEAQACGIQAAVTNVGGAAETLCPQTGIIIKPGDIEDIAKKLHAGLFKPSTISPRKFVISTADIRVMASAYDALAEERLYG